MVIHMSCFLPPELRPLSRLTETCLHFRPGSLINLKPCSYFDVCVGLQGVNMDGGLLNITSAVLGQTSSALRAATFSDNVSTLFCHVMVKGLSITASAPFDRVCFPHLISFF